MPVKIRVYGKEATFSQGCWSCDDDALLAMLESMVDPRGPFTPEVERAHAMYAAGRFGGLVLLETGWVPADHPDPEIRMEDVLPQRKPRTGLFSFLQRRPGKER